MQPIPDQQFRSWVLATFGGWCLGVVAVALLAVLEEAIHAERQFVLGLGMGFGVGFAQWRVGRKWFNVSSEWMLAIIVGMSVPFMLSDMAGVWMNASPERLLVPAAVLGGLLTGLWQRRLLRVRSVRANWWVAASTVGWLMATIFVFQAGRFGMPALVNIGIIAFGGVVLGATTGASLVWMLDRSVPSAGRARSERATDPTGA